MLLAKGLSSMEKWLCWGALGVSGFLLLLFVLDLIVSVPFGGGASLFMPIDILGVLATLLTGYLSWHTLRELR